MPPASSSSQGYRPDEITYPSRTIAFQAAGMITSIMENLQSHNEIRYTPAFIVYSLFSALIMHVYQMRSSVPSIVATSQERINICMQALKDVSKVWLVAKMVHTLFESILGNKVLEERLQKAPGKRHQRNKTNPDSKKQEAPKRKFEEMDIGLHNGGPTPPVSYERSRPQTPAVTPSRELTQAAALGSSQAGGNSTRNASDGFPGSANARGNTRPTTPFNPSFSMPTTPPDLFLVTRNSPNLSPTLWENFQPDQLFPDGTNFFPTHLASPQQGHVDPQLQMPTHPIMMNQQQQMPSRNQGSPSMLSGLPPELNNLPTQQQAQSLFGINNPVSWHGIDAALAGTSLDASSQDDTWSNSSRGGPTAPTTLNVEDWFQFFGINGSFGDVATDHPMTT